MSVTSRSPFHDGNCLYSPLYDFQRLRPLTVLHKYYFILWLSRSVSTYHVLITIRNLFHDCSLTATSDCLWRLEWEENGKYEKLRSKLENREGVTGTSARVANSATFLKTTYLALLFEPPTHRGTWSVLDGYKKTQPAVVQQMDHCILSLTVWSSSTRFNSHVCGSIGKVR